MVDLHKLRQIIEAAPATGAAATVTRAFLQEVEREIRERRASMALANADRRIAEANEAMLGSATA